MPPTDGAASGAESLRGECLRCEDHAELYDYPSGGFIITGPDGSGFRLPAKTRLCNDCHWQVVDQVRETGGLNKQLEDFA